MLQPRWIAGILAILMLVPHSATAGTPALTWRDWNASIFAEAKQQKRLVILDLKAVWCHWCHVMEEKTYGDAKVAELLSSNFITVRADQDANPDLSNRYGDWGWPATIIFAPDGQELGKLQGYIPPERMAPLLAAFIKDPTPGPSARAMLDVKPAATAVLSTVQRQTLLDRSAASYDERNGGWGSGHKYIDADSMDLSLAQAEAGDKAAAARVRQTLDAALLLIDPVEGGIYQYSDAQDWKSPHYEKIMAFQANALRHYSQAYALWREPRDLDAARNLQRYLTTVLLTPSGAFATSQDADVDANIHGKDYYALDAAGRRALGRSPRVDASTYARENGWAIQGLTAYHAATGDRDALAAALSAAGAMLNTRLIAGGGFRHGDNDRGGPFLGDTLAMGQASLDLYAATGDRAWLETASRAAAFISATFEDRDGGFATAPAPEASAAVFSQPAKPLDEQIAVARFANALHRYTGTAAHRTLAEHAMRYLASPTILDGGRPLPGIVVADQELAIEPTHVTVVAHKDDADGLALHAAALAYPAGYKRVDWWDKREGPMANPDVTYPELDRAAAFACTNNICSLPAFTPGELAERIRAITQAKVQ